MATVTSIVTAIKAVIDTLADVDQSSISDFVPAIETEKVAALIVPFEQDSTAQFLDVGGTYLEMSHAIRCEFWVKHTNASAATTAQRARDIALSAITALMQSDGTGYDLDPEGEFTERVDEIFTVMNDVAFLVVALTIPIRNEVTL